MLHTKTEVSPDAVTRRLNTTSELRRLCLALGRARPLSPSIKNEPQKEKTMSDTPELEDQLKKMIVELLFLKIQPDEIGTDDDLMETIDLDSVRIFDIVVGLETEMDIEIDEDEFDIENFRTVRQIAEFITKKQAGA